MFDNFITWEIIGSYVGAIAVTGIITQWLKPLIKQMQTQYTSFFIALILLNVSEYFLTGVTTSSVLLSIPNSIIVSIASNGAYDAISKTIPKTIKKGDKRK